MFVERMRENSFVAFGKLDKDHRSRIQKRCIRNRNADPGPPTKKQKVNEVKIPPLLEVHFDGKQREQSDGSKKECVSVSGPGMKKEKFLGDVAVDKGSGKNIAEAVFELLVKWNCDGFVIAMSFDTCSVNTGIHTGRFNLVDFFQFGVSCLI